MNDFEAITI